MCFKISKQDKRVIIEGDNFFCIYPSFDLTFCILGFLAGNKFYSLPYV